MARPPPTRSIKIHDQDVLQGAIDKIYQGKSVYSVSRDTGIPETTLREHARGRFQGYNTSFGPNKCLTDEEETTLVKYILYMSDRGFPLTRSMIKRLVVNMIKETGRRTSVNLDKGPSNRWVRKFLKRHKELSVRKPHPLDKARASLEQCHVTGYFNMLLDTLTRLGITNEPSLIFNCDETGFSGNISKAGENVVVKKGSKQAYQVKLSLSGHITANIAISATGQVLPPQVIFSKNLPRSSYTDGLPQNWQFESTESGFMNTELFYKWFTELFLTHCGNKRPVLLIMDNLGAHLSPKLLKCASDNGVDLLFFPPHSSHLLQPLDVDYFHVLKTKLVQLANGLVYSGAKTLPRHLFPILLHQSMNTITPGTVAASFSACGVFPYNGHTVKALTPPISKRQSAQDDGPVRPSTSTTDVANGAQQILSETEVCHSCGKPTHNMLVRIGMVPEHLANIFIEPPDVSESKSAKRRATSAARVYEAKRPKKAVQLDSVTDATSTIPDTTPITSDAPSDHSDTDVVTCPICKTSRSDYFWVGCDKCPAWFHYECLDSCEKIDADLSMLTESAWNCRLCNPED